MFAPRVRCAVGCLALLLTGSVTLASSEFAGYRIPDHHWSSWNVSGLADGSRSQSEGAFSGQTRQGRVQGLVASRAVWGFDSDGAQQQFLLDLIANGNRSEQRQEAPAPAADRALGRSRALAERVTVQYRAARYPWTAPLGFEADGAFDASFNQGWESSASQQFTDPTEQRFSGDGHGQGYRYESSLSLGVVAGRTRDATPVYEARVLEQRLRESGVLTVALSPRARERLTALFAVRGRVSFAHERPGRWFWREVERVLTEEGATGERGFDAFATLFALEPVRPSAVQRLTGWSFEPLVRLAANRARDHVVSTSGSSQWQGGVLISGSETTIGTSSSTRQDFLSAGWRAEYHRPVGMSWQLDAVHELSYDDKNALLETANELSAVWLLADRWRVSSVLSHQAFADHARAGNRRLDSWQVSSVSRVDYFLEDAWTVGLFYTLAQLHGTSSFQTFDDVGLGVTYQLSGLFSAPGLVQPMRLAPPQR
jgi:hypothetical protein